MSDSISRMQFLSGDFSGKSVIRPPWALEEERFVELCSRCGDCIAACPHDLIREARGKFPAMDFSNAGCDFCSACVLVCQPAALVHDDVEQSSPWSLKATILKACLALNGVICRSCGEACEPRSIRFKLQVGGTALPVVDLESCTGCGECFAVCPVRSIELSPADSRERAA